MNILVFSLFFYFFFFFIFFLFFCFFIFFSVSYNVFVIVFVDCCFCFFFFFIFLVLFFSGSPAPGGDTSPRWLPFKPRRRFVGSASFENPTNLIGEAEDRALHNKKKTLIRNWL